MGSRIEQWLLAMCDPCGPAGLPAKPLREAELRAAIQLADSHGVLPALAANLRTASCQFGPQRLVRACCAETAGRAIASAVGGAEQALLRQSGRSLLLRRRWEALAAAMRRRDLPGIALKGPDFADRLYPHAGLRPFRDIDILVPQNASAQVESLLTELGYAPADETGHKYADGYAERSFLDGDGCSIELHWNLVNSPTVRSGVSVGLEDLQLEHPPAGGFCPQPSAASCLLIAAVHGAASHSFDRLQLLCDVRQIVRGAAGELDEGWLAQAAARCGASLALACALRLTAGTLRDPPCRALLGRLGLGRHGRAWRWVLSRRTVLHSQGPLSSARRQLFRELLKKR